MAMQRLFFILLFGLVDGNEKRMRWGGEGVKRQVRQT